MNSTAKPEFHGELKKLFAFKKQDFDCISVEKRRRADGTQRCRRKKMQSRFNLKQLLAHIGDTPSCYLTGKPIDLRARATYHFDHKVPVSRGGTNELSNFGLCTPDANFAKATKTPEEFLLFCKEVLEYNGYIVTQNTENPKILADDSTS